MPRRVLITADAVGGVWTYALDLARGLAARRRRRRCSPCSGLRPIRWSSAADACGSRAWSWSRPACRSTGRPSRGREPRRRRRRASPRSARETGVDLVHLNSPALAARRELPARRSWWSPLLPRHLVGARCSGGADAGGLPLAHRLDGARALAAPTPCWRRAAPSREATAAGLRARPRQWPRVVANGRAPPAGPARADDEPRARWSLTAGRLWDEGKNVSALIDAAAARAGARSAPRRPLIGPHGAQARARRTPRALGSSPAPSWPRWLAARPVFASAALYEPFGLAVLEAAQAGCALVLSDIPTFRELWDGAALFVPPDDRGRARAQALDDALARPARRRALGQRGPRARGRYTVEAMAHGHARRLPARCCRERSDAGGGAPHEGRLLHPLAGLLLEPRQRPFPARRAARADPRAATTCACSSRADAWSLRNLLRRPRRGGPRRLPRGLPGAARRSAYERRRSTSPRPLDGADLVIVHEWNEPGLVAALGPSARAAAARFTLLFHDTHHRAVSDPDAMRAFDLAGYDGVLAFGEALARGLSRLGLGRARPRLARGGRRRACSIRRPRKAAREGLVWIGNWGDGERTRGARATSCSRPARAAGLPLDVHGVRYPAAALGAAGALRRALPRLAAERRARRRSSPATWPRCTCRARFYVDALPGHPDHPRVRGAGLRHPAGLRALAATARACSGRARTILVARDGDGDDAPPARLCRRPGLRASLARSGLADHPRAPHLRPPGRRTAGDRPARSVAAPPSRGGSVR